MNTPPFKAKQMTPCKPASETPNHGEYSATAVYGNTRPMHKPSKASVGGALVDGPFGGKKPA